MLCNLGRKVLQEKEKKKAGWNGGKKEQNEKNTCHHMRPFLEFVESRVFPQFLHDRNSIYVQLEFILNFGKSIMRTDYCA